MWITYGKGGWVLVEDEDLPGHLYLRFSRDERGRWGVQEVYLQGEWRRVVAGDLRAVPLTAIETSIDTDKLSDRYVETGPKLSVLAGSFGTTFGGQARHWVAESYRQDDPPLRRPRRRSGEPKPPPRLGRPIEGIDDAFLRHVSASYAHAVRGGRSPAIELAEQAKVPVRTVHRWIYTARQRGFLPPARRGRIT